MPALFSWTEPIPVASTVSVIKADMKKRIEVVTSVLPETRTSIFIDDVLPLAKDVGRHYIGKTAGVPFERDTGWIEKKDCVIPITLESNVKELHEFLFDDYGYQVSQTVQDYSNQIVADSGLGDEYRDMAIQNSVVPDIGSEADLAK